MSYAFGIELLLRPPIPNVPCHQRSLIEYGTTFTFTLYLTNCIHYSLYVISKHWCVESLAV